MEFRLGPWLPDETDFKNPGLEVCQNVVPTETGYAPARSPIPTSAAIPGTIIGADTAYLSNDLAVTVVATNSDLYVIRDFTVTASGLGLSIPAGERMAFARFGSSIYASTRLGGTWVLGDVETDNAFIAASGSPPRANAMARVADFLVMGDLRDIDTLTARYRIRWSRFNNPAGTWGTDIATQAGAIDLDPRFGIVTAIAGGSDGLVFQRQGISRLTFTGGATVFALDVFEKERGCVAPQSLVQIGEASYYLSHDGFFMTDGSTPRAISTGKVWEWFLSNVNQEFLGKVVGSVDYQSRCIVWLFSGAPASPLTGQIWYHWPTGKWSYVDQALEWVVEGSRQGLTLEQVSLLYPNLDTMSLSLDSPEFLARYRDLQAFSGGFLSTMAGAPLAATWQTGDFQPFPGRRSFVEQVAPLVEAPQVNVRLGSKDRMTASFVEGDAVPMGPLGFAPVNVDARYFRVRLDIPAGVEWGNAYGAQVTARESGLT